MSKVEFTEAFETRARIRAIEILVGALIAELPDIGAFRARVDTDLDAVANALNDVARALGEASRPDALHVSDGFTASVKEHMDAIMNGASITTKPLRNTLRQRQQDRDVLLV